jgi:hypothetical protein
MAKRKTAARIVSRLSLEEQGIEPRILLVRGQKVLLDRDLATLYEVKAIALRQQVRRNAKRFPKDFVFELNKVEVEALVSQNVIASHQSLGGAKPLAFTEQGIAMLSSVLSSDRAIEVNLAIMRTFVNMRKSLAGHEELMGYLKAQREQAVPPNESGTERKSAASACPSCAGYGKAQRAQAVPPNESGTEQKSAASACPSCASYSKDMAWTQNLHTDQIREISIKLNWILDPPLSDTPRRPIGYPAGA